VRRKRRISFSTVELSCLSGERGDWCADDEDGDVVEAKAEKVAAE
jgi:hypothetical protein